MTVAYTSKLAYASIEDLGDKQYKVLMKIEELQPCSNTQIARALGWEINRVTGRVNELAKMKFIECEKLGVNELGRSVKLWQIREREPVQCKLL